MTKTIDLLHGKIMRSLCILAVPIVMTYFIQMAYNFIDMIWIGRLGSGAVAGVGVAGMFTWFSNGLVMMAKMGGQVKIGHCLGAGDDDDARRYLGAALTAWHRICPVFRHWYKYSGSLTDRLFSSEQSGSHP